VTLVVSGKTVKGRVNGSYTYMFLDKKYTDPFSGTFNGTLAEGGSIEAKLTGKIGTSNFTGKLTGGITKGQANGSWTANSIVTASGGWSCRKK